jgi:hypothetical protein
MYVWNSCEILLVLLTYFISLIITEHIRIMKNLQCKKRSCIKTLFLQYGCITCCYSVCSVYLNINSRGLERKPTREFILHSFPVVFSNQGKRLKKIFQKKRMMKEVHSINCSAYYYYKVFHPFSHTYYTLGIQNECSAM